VSPPEERSRPTEGLQAPFQRLRDADFPFRAGTTARAFAAAAQGVAAEDLRFAAARRRTAEGVKCSAVTSV